MSEDSSLITPGILDMDEIRLLVPIKPQKLQLNKCLRIELRTRQVQAPQDLNDVELRPPSP